MKRNFLQLLIESDEANIFEISLKYKYHIIISYIHWIDKISNKDPLRRFILYDKLTSLLQNNQQNFQNERFINVWTDFAEFCEDQTEVYHFMLKKGIFKDKFTLINKMILYHCNKEEFENSKNTIKSLCKNLRKDLKSKLYEKLKSSLESKINELLKISIIFPEVISSFLNKKIKQDEFCPNLKQKSNEKMKIINDEKHLIAKAKKLSNENIAQNCQDLVMITSSQSIKELKTNVDYLILKYKYIHEFLLQYDEEFKRHHMSLKEQITKKKPHSWLNLTRFKPRIPTSLVIKSLEYMNLTYYYEKALNSQNSLLINFVLSKTSNLPSVCKTIFQIDQIEKDCIEYLFKINVLAYTKYDRENYSSKISLMRYINNNFHVRSITMNYAIKNIIYLHGINENYIGIFTPFYFILFDTKNLTFVSRFRFEINHYSDENVVCYPYNYNPRFVTFSILNIIYVVGVDPSRETFSIKHKFEGHKDEVTNLSYKNLNSLNLLISASKSQIIIYNLDHSTIHKILSIDESKLFIKQLQLLEENVLTILTMYNQLYILEFSEDSDINSVKIINFTEDEYIFTTSGNQGKFIFKINSNILSLYDVETEKSLIKLENDNLRDSDVIILSNNDIIKKYNSNNSKVAILNLY
jgi:hypothetical protein